MAAERQERKSRRNFALAVRRAPDWAWIGTVFLLFAAATQLAAQSFVSNVHTGLAIDGYDPVAYFVDGEPRLGRADLEQVVVGAIWRFRNEGNRGAFVADPQIYAPQFTGHDPIAVTRGALAPGHPSLWMIVENRLYLFQTAQSREAFAANAQEMIDVAERRWLDLVK